MYTKVLIVLVLATVALAHPGRRVYDDYGPVPYGPRPLKVLGPRPYAPYGPRPYGPKDDYYVPKPYDFGYETVDEDGSKQNRQESSDGHGRKTGSYGYVDPWGTYRQVDYIADELGFRAKVKTNEPGTANQNPAAVEVFSDQYHSKPLPPPHVPQPYDFGYETKDEYGGSQNRQESSDGHGGIKGTYGYTDPHGIYRQVDYVADEHGFRAKVRTNEPGTANQNPAAVGVHAEPPVPVHPPIILVFLAVKSSFSVEYGENSAEVAQNRIARQQDYLADPYHEKPQPYNFGYETKDEFGTTVTRQETGDESGTIKGTYGYVDPFGVYRHVEYEADEYGYRARIKTNEPSASNQNPADVTFLVEAPPPQVASAAVPPIFEGQQPIRKPVRPPVIPRPQRQNTPSGTTITRLVYPTHAHPIVTKVIAPGTHLDGHPSVTKVIIPDAHHPHVSQIFEGRQPVRNTVVPRPQRQLTPSGTSHNVYPYSHPLVKVVTSNEPSSPSNPPSNESN
ncbi:uncharacterized protein [Centruroides vittatus]|uniref:uncharacterized protein n=1 Tax=Centruroides vittatus TaxID=120091 RepID=UPI00350EDB5B